MAETSWFYSEGGQERGPITTAQLKELAATGKLKGTDLVWKEGMAEWTAANQIKGLISADSPAPQIGSEPSGKVGPKVSKLRLPTGDKFKLGPLVGSLKSCARPLLIAGFVMAVMSRGCDSLSKRDVEGLQEEAKAAEREFNDEWDATITRTRRRKVQLNDNASRTESENEELKGIDEKLAGLSKERDDKKILLTDGAWREMRIDATNAASSYVINAYWRQWVFEIGTIALVIGLLGVSFNSEGPERTICMIMLAIITFSIFVGGAVIRAG